MRTSVIVAGARTPIGRLQGGLAALTAADLGAVAIEAALDKAGVSPENVQYVIMGQVLTAGAGQMPARQAAAKAGIPMTTPSLNVNKVCLSGVESIILADQFVRSGAFDVVVAGGMESMSQAPHLLPGSRGGYKYGDVTLVDHMARDGLHDAFTDRPMGLLTEAGNDLDVIAREAAGRVRGALARTRREGLGRRGFRRRGGGRGDPRTPRREHVDAPGRRRAPRHHARASRETASGVPRRRHRHRRQRVDDQRRRLRGGRDEQGPRRRPRV